ncbi:putative disease resistance protein [Camellia lanceoleosa]|uniref:Disease resistance protein n=1 Tax=Camellia lanceoleosa TaxID=1840588 RepID=A0ACC0H140_9ERIC|nr:putative disease resistance protein [Camellia lanceoleosa]
MGYLNHHKKNSKKLQDEKEKLENEVRRINGRVERARTNNEIPEADVLQWIKLANGMKIDVEEFLGEGENKLCFNWCPNIYWRYQLGKDSKEKIDRVISLKDEGYEDFDSRAKIFKEIIKALEDLRIKMIGVYGAGSVGKTTMVVEVGKLAKRNGVFGDVAIATVSQTLDEKIVKEKIASQLGLTLNGNADSLIRVLEASTKEILIGVLAEIEAWTLFKKTTGISIDSEIPSEAKEVCDKCGGLPVPIRAVVAALKGKGKRSWKYALRQLKNYKMKEIAGIEPNLFISLKWSYDRLEPKDARSCFLLCSLFPEDAEISIDDLVRYSFGMRLLDQNLNIFDEVRDRVLAMVDILNESCLLLDGMNENVVKMHDVI